MSNSNFNTSDGAIKRAPKRFALRRFAYFNTSDGAIKRNWVRDNFIKQPISIPVMVRLKDTELTKALIGNEFQYQ